ncbi:hypothetical protein [Nocardioides lijunqiniae]|uniref:hypothetical protein n=1 Tax=Nocardioides lijunqiniae TaxID=2760832 RepID=UPI0018777A54|nr:hypothetical protein [Nocardioides lijunqiniae]
MRTLRPREAAMRGAGPPEQDRGHTLVQNEQANARLAEDQMPRPVIVVHGVLAGVLMLLVLLVALGVF